jgi:Cys-rich protein (TIGR01571 family)
LWTPCLAFGFNKQKFDSMNGQISPHWCGPSIAYCGSNLIGGFLMLTYGTCILNAYNVVPSPDIVQSIISIGGALGTACYAGNFRKKIREKYLIDGTLRGDICTHFWCSPCALCQETAELKYQNEVIIDTTKAPYIQVMTE